MHLLPLPWHPHRPAWMGDPRHRVCPRCGRLVYLAALGTVLSRHTDGDHECTGSHQREQTR